MDNINYDIKELKLSAETTSFSVNFGLNRPYVRIVQENGLKIPKIMVILAENTTVETINVAKEVGDDEHPISKSQNIHFIVKVQLNIGENVADGYKIIELQLDQNKSEVVDHFEDINSFMTVACMDKEDILGTMTIASYQNGGSVDRPPFIG
ncbi:hypothetical protein [Polaribacter aestuariivivens]|uniref:hypothetical protein n=1 Tax=Polaribacter aestuariivivens TaxID=2304626 RepID=UPI003F4956CD